MSPLSTSSPGFRRRFLAVMAAAVVMGAMTIAQTAAQTAQICSLDYSCAPGFTMDYNPSPGSGENPCVCCEPLEPVGSCTGIIVSCPLASLPNCVSCSADDICGECDTGYTLDTIANTCDGGIPDLAEFVELIHAACPDGTFTFLGDEALTENAASVCCQHYGEGTSPTVTEACGEDLPALTGPAALNCVGTVPNFPFACCGAVAADGTISNVGRSCPPPRTGDAAAASESTVGLLAVIAVTAAAVCFAAI